MTLPGQQIVRHELDPIIVITDPAGANGICQAYAPKVPAGQALLIDHATCENTSTTPTSLDLYEDNVATTANRLSGTLSGNLDEADWPNGLQVGPNRRLLARWSGASAGSVGTLRLQVRRVIGEL